MALTQYRIPSFYGINQSVCENDLAGGESPDACNMDTAGGRLAVGKGYVRENEAAITGQGRLKRLFVWNRPSGKIYVAAAGSVLMALPEEGAAWQTIHTYTGTAAGALQYDFQVMKIGSTEYLLVANGCGQIQKWDGSGSAAEAFGSAEGLSNLPVNFIEVYYSRLFAAGDPDHPARLYWSAAPGGDRTVEDWSSMEEGENVSGGHVEVGTDSDPITGIFALSNQLVIFKRDSLYRLLGDRPANFRILPVNAAMRQPVHTAVVRYGNVLYFLTDGGLYYFDGQEVHRQRDADKVQTLLKQADVTAAMGAVCRDVLYFALKEDPYGDAPDAVLTYDLARGCYMVRRGFAPRDLFGVGGRLYLLDGSGYVNRFNEGDTYGGARINAYWKTPMTDLNQKIANKRMMELYLRGTGGMVGVEAATSGGASRFERLMPGNGNEVMEVPLSGEGRAFSLQFMNVNGSAFTLDGGVEVLLDVQRRIL